MSISIHAYVASCDFAYSRFLFYSTNILLAAFCQFPFAKTQTVSTEKLWIILLYRDALKMLVTLTHLGLISRTYLRTALAPVAPKSVRIQSSCQYLFTLLGSTGVKAECRTLMKLTPGVNFINMLICSFYSNKCSVAELLYQQLRPTLPVNKTRNYAQFLHLTLYAIRQ